MTVYQSIEGLKFEGSVVTIGSFDGVHCGHKVLIGRVIELARQYGSRSVVVTFWPHPRQVLDKEGNVPLLLNTLDEKVSLLKQTGIDDVVVFPFDKELSQMLASDFIRDIVVGKLGARCLIVGQDHHFGKNRSGNAQHLPAFAAQSAMQVEVVDLKTLDRKISSSAIREALAEGNLQLANDMLGYDYMISGQVIAGNHLGRTIGFPTANIQTPSCKLLPEEGVYRVKVYLGDIRSCSVGPSYSHLGMMYIGKRPVLKQQDTKQHIEVNIFDFDQQIYGLDVTLALTHRIRNDIKFENLEQLAGQLNHDKQNILNII